MFEKGNELFKNGIYFEAESLYTEAINIRSKSNYYFNRGITRLFLYDTSGFCSDMKYLKEINDIPAIDLYKQSCIKYDSLSYFYYRAAIEAINKHNFVLADTLLNLSIKEDDFVENYFYKGVVGLTLGDTCKFCVNMLHNYDIKEVSKLNFNKFCRDTVFYEKGFLKISKTKTPYYQIKFKHGEGAYYNEKIKNKIFNPKPRYWQNEHAIGFYYNIDTNDIFTFADVSKFDINGTFDSFINKNLMLDEEIEGIFLVNLIDEFPMLLTYTSSETGEIIDVQSEPTKAIKEKLIDMKDFEILNSKILQKIQDIMIYAPKMKPAHVGDKAVKFKRRTKIIVRI